MRNDNIKVEFVNRKIKYLQKEISSYLRNGGELEFMKYCDQDLYLDCKKTIRLVRDVYAIYVKSVRGLLSILGYEYKVNSCLYDIDDFDRYDEAYKVRIRDSYNEYLDNNDYLTDDNGYSIYASYDYAR